MPSSRARRDPAEPGDGDHHAGIRLQKLLAQAGVASRRAAESLITAGRVTVNGRAVRALGSRADPQRDVVRVDGRRLPRRPGPRYVLLNKPAGVVTTRRDPQGRPTVLEVARCDREYLYPVGRLDFDSEGLVLLTNDGALAAKLTHPRHEIARVYEAHVRGIPSPAALDRLRRGIPLDGRRTTPATVRLVRVQRAREGDQAVLQLAISEGRNRQVRRMLQAIGHRVVALRRTRFGPLRATGLGLGQARELTAREVAALHRAVATEPPGGRRRTPATRKGDVKDTGRHRD